MRAVHDAADASIEAMGLAFPGRVGLAAGYDREGSFLPCFRKWGFGFIELGTVTRLRAPGHNPGVRALTQTLERSGMLDLPTAQRGVIGISIGVHSGADSREAVRDYVEGIRCAWRSADYLALNLAPRDARMLPSDAHIARLLQRVREECEALTSISGRRVPVVLKLPVAASRHDSLHTAALAHALGFDGLIAALGDDDRRDALLGLERLTHGLQGAIPVIAVGGIRTQQDALRVRDAGAELVQIHRGFEVHGCTLVRSINAAWGIHGLLRNQGGDIRTDHRRDHRDRQA